MHPQPGSYHIAKVTGGANPINRATGTPIYPISFPQTTTTFVPPDFPHDNNQTEGLYDNIYGLSRPGNYYYSHSVN